MARWTGWVAAFGGLIAFGYYIPSIASWIVPLGDLIALVFGIWSVYEK